MKCVSILMMWCVAQSALLAETGKLDSAKAAASTQVGEQQVRVQMEFVEVTNSQALRLLEGGKSDADRHSTVRKWMNEHLATLVDFTAVTVTTEAPASTESVEEVFYPKEYEQAVVPESVALDGNGESVTLSGVSAPALAKKFEQRDIGTKLNVVASVKDDGDIHLRLAPELSYYVDDYIFAEWKDKANVADVAAPSFYAVRFHTSVKLQLGKQLLVSVQTPVDQDGEANKEKKLLVFVKASALTN